MNTITMNEYLVSSASSFCTVDLKLKGFKVYEIETAISPVPSYSRRNFYKICMITGRTIQPRIDVSDR